MKIVDKLREIAEECETGERSPVTGISTWPKETTIEWKAADIIQETFNSLLSISEADGSVPAEALRYMAKRNLVVLLAMCNDPELDN